MIAMQYNFVLPADYDMTIIDRRIADKGRITDGLPGLVFKAYLTTRKASARVTQSENRYAPFYLWTDAGAMNDFLCGPGFVAVSQSFGWPSVSTWSVWHAAVAARIEESRFASRELVPIPPYSRLDEIRAAEARRARALVDEHGACAAICGFDPTGWHVVRFTLWAQPPAPSSGTESAYQVGHVSRGATP